jgi:hypothetical protein
MLVTYRGRSVGTRQYFQQVAQRFFTVSGNMFVG